VLSGSDLQMRILENKHGPTSSSLEFNIYGTSLVKNYGMELFTIAAKCTVKDTLGLTIK
jgi:hypothetical protein